MNYKVAFERYTRVKLITVVMALLKRLTIVLNTQSVRTHCNAWEFHAGSLEYQDIKADILEGSLELEGPSSDRRRLKEDRNIIANDLYKAFNSYKEKHNLEPI